MDINISVNISILIISAVSVIMDCLTWKISNIWLYSWMGVGFIFNGIVFGTEGIIRALFGFLVPVAVLGIFFYFRMIGAGDIKLFGALGTWIGPDSILMCMLWSFIAAAVMAVMILILNRTTKERLRYLKDYFKRFFGSNVKTDYEIQSAGKARIHISIPVLIGVILKIIGVYA